MKYVSAIETFFNFDDATLWLGKYLEEFEGEDWLITGAQIQLTSGGAFQAGFSAQDRQGDLFSGEEG